MHSTASYKKYMHLPSLIDAIPFLHLVMCTHTYSYSLEHAYVMCTLPHYYDFASLIIYCSSITTEDFILQINKIAHYAQDRSISVLIVNYKTQTYLHA